MLEPKPKDPGEGGEGAKTPTDPAAKQPDKDQAHTSGEATDDRK